MNDDLALRLFFVMFFLAVVWLGLVSYLFHALKQRHAEMYEALGSPRGFEPRTTQALFLFLLSRRPESLGDPAMRQLANLMRVLLVVYLFGFLYLVFLVAGSRAAA